MYGLLKTLSSLWAYSGLEGFLLSVFTKQIRFGVLGSNEVVEERNEE